MGPHSNPLPATAAEASIWRCSRKSRIHPTSCNRFLAGAVQGGSMADSPLTSRLPDPLEERLTSALPKLKAHLAAHSRRVPGSEPEDMAQEVVARALRYRESYDEGRALWPWLRTVAQRVLHTHRARDHRLPESIEEYDPVDPRPRAQTETREELARLLNSLRSVERDVLLRFHDQNQSVREISHALSLPEGTIKSHLSRARKRLASLTSAESQDE